MCFNSTDWEGGIGGAGAGYLFLQAEESMYSSQTGSSSGTDRFLIKFNREIKYIADLNFLR